MLISSEPWAFRGFPARILSAHHKYWLKYEVLTAEKIKIIFPGV
jgi:hypothetical protein